MTIEDPFMCIFLGGFTLLRIFLLFIFVLSSNSFGSPINAPVKTYSIGTGLPLTHGFLYENICKVALAQLGLEHAEVEVRVQQEKYITLTAYVPAAGQRLHNVETLSPKAPDNSDIYSKMIKQALMTAQVDAGNGRYNQYTWPDQKNVPPKEVDPKVTFLRSEVYDYLLSFRVNVDVADHNIPVTVQRIDAQARESAGKILLAPAGWELVAGIPRPVDNDFTRAKIGDPNVEKLDFESLPAALQEKIKNFDLWNESVNLTHSSPAWSHYATTDHDKNKPLGFELFTVTSEKQIKGYILQAQFLRAMMPSNTKILVIYTVKFDVDGFRADFGGTSQGYYPARDN
jgi:hypothetical protein